MSTFATLVVSIALSVNSGVLGNTDAVAVTTIKHVFTQGLSPMRDCRKYEAAYHSGNGEIVKRGIKSISRVDGPRGNQEYEITTFCVEEA